MKCNVGAMDGTIRILAGAMLFGISYFAVFPTWVTATFYAVAAPKAA